MPEEENSKTQANIVEKKDITNPSTNDSWYKNGGIGLAGGVVGALIVMVLSTLFQDEKQDDLALKIEAQAERIEELKIDREKEFSKILTTISDLNIAHQGYETVLESLNEDVHRSTVTQESQATQLQNITEVTISLGGEIENLKDRLAMFETLPSRNDALEHQEIWGAELAILKTRLEALEQEGATISELTQQLEQMRSNYNQQLEQLQANYETISTHISDALIKQNQEIKNIQSMIDSLSSVPPPTSDQGMAMLIAANSLKAAVERGGSYRNELQVFSPLAPANVSLDVLEKYATSGLPNIAELSQRFAKLADEIAATENTLPEDAGITDQLLHQGSRLYSSRPVGNVEGSDAAAIAARMEVAINNGDFFRALNEAQNLPEDAKTLAADFIELLQAREAVDALLSRLIATTLQEEKDELE